MSNLTIPRKLAATLTIALSNPGKQYIIDDVNLSKITGLSKDKTSRNGLSPDPLYRRTETKTKGTTYKQTIHMYQLKDGRWVLFNPVWRFSSTPKMTVEAPGQATLIGANIAQFFEFRMEYKDKHENFENDLLELARVIL